MSPETPLDISIDAVGADGHHVSVLRAQGEVDLASADRLDEALDSAGGSNSGRLVLDLRGLTFIDSSGLRVVLVALRDFSPGFGVIVTPGSPVERLFEVAQILDRLPVFPSEEAAVAAVLDEAT
jgi:anti-anti-sigma factor